MQDLYDQAYNEGYEKGHWVGLLLAVASLGVGGAVGYLLAYMGWL